MWKAFIAIVAAIALAGGFTVADPGRAVAQVQPPSDGGEHAATLWWVIFNKPHKCKGGSGGALCGESDLFRRGVKACIAHASGNVTAIDGHVYLVSSIYQTKGNVRCEFNELRSNNGRTGLFKPKKAEVHVIVRSHGPAGWAGTDVDDQLRQFEDPGCANTGGHGFSPCQDVQFAIHTPGSGKHSVSDVFWFDNARLGGGGSQGRLDAAYFESPGALNSIADTQVPGAHSSLWRTRHSLTVVLETSLVPF
ncbi:MAG: hypothetical protein OEM59_23080 [Rhodospirillales bacterium]|nr:hypothetical protein [Rhodospirillales bacterium]